MRGKGPGAAGEAGVLGSKWAATAASVWIQCTSGSSYCFGIYSPLLKSSQGYDQSTLDSVAVFKDVGANAGLLSGLLYTLSSSFRPRGGAGNGRFWGGGPWIVHAVGAAQCFAGYFPMWLAVTGLVPRPPVPLMCFYMFIAAHAQTFFNTANVVTAVQNFPSNRGTVVGIMKVRVPGRLTGLRLANSIVRDTFPSNRSLIGVNCEFLLDDGVLFQIMISRLVFLSVGIS